MINNLVIKYFKIIPEDLIITLEDSNARFLINNPKKHIRQVSSINSITNLFLKKIKINNLIKLNNIDSIFNILINIFCYFFQDISIYFKNYK
jgi:hypothetical protein